MKKMMIMVCAIMMAAAANAKRVETVSFDEVRVNVPARVRVVAGETYGVNVAAQNELVSASIRCTVKDGVLYISTRDVENLIKNGESLHITVVAPENVKVSVGRDMQAMSTLKNFDEEKTIASK